jgi:uncharacterized protein YndB with AHSA1/START domain
MTPMTHKADPKLDLVFERVVDVPKDLVWAAWTQPEHLKKWFTPAPWKTVDCEIDLRPGGIFRTVMQSPEGKDFPNLGCYLEVIPGEKLVWTNTMGPGYRPRVATPTGPSMDFPFTVVITLESQGAKTKYRAIAIHGDETGRKTHEGMGFQEGWGKACEQLVALFTK